MNALITLLNTCLYQVAVTFLHNWPFLLVSILGSVLLKLYLDPNRLSEFLIKHKRAGVIGATAAAVATPLCSCGTTAILLGMMASLMPWAPIVAFMVASPLTSPEELIYSAGLFGWPFAIAFFLTSIILGLLGGAAASFLEARGWLRGQTRYHSSEPAGISQPSHTSLRPSRNTFPSLNPAVRAHLQPAAETACACEPASRVTVLTNLRIRPEAERRAMLAQIASRNQNLNLTAPGYKGDTLRTEQTSCACETGTNDQRPVVSFRRILAELVKTGRQLLVMFAVFAFIGYFLNGLIPAGWVAALFGPGHVYSVPLAATLGLPFYINSEGSLPLVRAMLDGGMSQGAALAFLITGAGTSVGAVAGALTIARWRVIGLVVGTLWAGAIGAGLLYDALLASGLF